MSQPNSSFRSIEERRKEVYQNVEFSDEKEAFDNYVSRDLFAAVMDKFDVPFEKFDGCAIANLIDKDITYGTGESGYVMPVVRNNETIDKILSDAQILGDLAVKDYDISDINSAFDLCLYKDSMPDGWFESNEEGYPEIKYSNNDYACEIRSPFHEAIIGMIASRNTVYSSPNFMKIYSMSVCNIKDKNYGAGFIFMEKISNTLDKLISSNQFMSFDIDNIIFEVMHALACIQHPNLMLMHGDLHTGNIFLYKFQNNKPEAEYLEYIVDNKKFYINNTTKNYILKMGDWDWGAKFAEPRILNSIYAMAEVHPTYYAPAYDIQFFLHMLAIELDKQKIHYTPFLEECLDWAYKGEHHALDEAEEYHRGTMNSDIRRVNIDYGDITARNFFDQSFVSNKYSKANSSNIYRDYANVNYQKNEIKEPHIKKKRRN